MNLQTLQQFFSGDDKLLSIPHYQRDYAWSIPNVEDLFNDIQESIETETSHYIGTFILANKDRKQSYMVVDGQQRLTTLYMLLDVLVSGIEDERKRTAYTYSFLQNSEGIRKLQLVGENNTFFDQLLSRESPDPKVKSQRLLASAYQYMLEHLNELNPDARILWVNTIKHFEIMELIENDEGKAIRIFQSVNDRGVPLSNMDKTKSLLIYYSNRFLEGELDALINENFGVCFKAYDLVRELACQEGLNVSLLSSKSFSEDDILRYHYLSYKKRVNGIEEGFSYNANIDYVLSNYLKPNLRALRDEHVDLKNFISSYASDLSAFFLSFESLLQAARGNFGLYQLLVVQNASAFVYPLMIRLHQRNLLLSEWNFLSKVAIFDMRIYKIRGTDPAKDIYTIAHDSYDADPKEISNRLLWVVERFMNDSEMESAVTNYVRYGNYGLPAIFTSYELSLWEADGVYAVEGPTKLSKLIELVKAGQTIEHILPQEPDATLKRYGFTRREEYDDYIDKIGNLILLTKSENSSYSNASPDVKVSEKYPNSVYASVRQIGACFGMSREVFSKNDIDVRSAGLAKFCINRWPLWEQL